MQGCMCLSKAVAVLAIRELVMVCCKPTWPICHRWQWSESVLGILQASYLSSLPMYTKCAKLLQHAKPLLCTQGEQHAMSRVGPHTVCHMQCAKKVLDECSVEPECGGSTHHTVHQGSNGWKCAATYRLYQAHTASTCRRTVHLLSVCDQRAMRRRRRT